jgi:hypothetical protein
MRLGDPVDHQLGQVVPSEQFAIGLTLATLLYQQCRQTALADMPDDRSELDEIFSDVNAVFTPNTSL